MALTISSSRHGEPDVTRAGQRPFESDRSECALASEHLPDVWQMFAAPEQFLA
jgi:hypothetical protein